MAELAKFIPSAEDEARLQILKPSYRAALTAGMRPGVTGAVADLSRKRAIEVGNESVYQGLAPQKGPQLSLRDFAEAGQIRPDSGVPVSVSPPPAAAAPEPSTTPIFTNRPGMIPGGGVATGYGDITSNMELASARQALSAPVQGPLQAARAPAGRPGMFATFDQAVYDASLPAAAPTEATSSPSFSRVRENGVVRPMTEGESLVEQNRARWMAANPEANGVMPGFGPRDGGFRPNNPAALALFGKQAAVERGERARSFRQALLAGELDIKQREEARATAMAPLEVGYKQALIRQADATTAAAGKKGESDKFGYKAPGFDEFSGKTTLGELKIGDQTYSLDQAQNEAIEADAKAELIAFQKTQPKPLTTEQAMKFLNKARQAAYVKNYLSGE